MQDEMLTVRLYLKTTEAQHERMDPKVKYAAIVFDFDQTITEKHSWMMLHNTATLDNEWFESLANEKHRAHIRQCIDKALALTGQDKVYVCTNNYADVVWGYFRAIYPDLLESLSIFSRRGISGRLHDAPPTVPYTWVMCKVEGLECIAKAHGLQKDQYGLVMHIDDDHHELEDASRAGFEVMDAFNIQL